MRYYYTDPLAAAWMAKHFGMRFTDCAGFDVSACPTMFDFSERHGLAEALFIGVDSLHLLEPQHGDLLGVKSKGYGDGYFRHLADLPEPFDYIIQRNGKAFMWPESEEA